jgi:hypothetical protein
MPRPDRCGNSMQDQSFSEAIRAAGLASKEKNGLAVDHAASVMAGLSRPSTRFGLCARWSRTGQPAKLDDVDGRDEPGHDGDGLESHLRESYQASQPIAIIDKHGDEL